MFAFKKNYFYLTLGLLLVEVLIALFVNDRIIRPYIGDFLVVILIYFFLRTFIDQKPWFLAIATLIFSFLVEFAQYFKVVEWLGLKGNRFAEIIIGAHFSWHDLVAYTLGVGVAYWVDKRISKD